MQNINLEPSFWENLWGKLKFWAPVIFSVENLQCLSEKCNFLHCLLLTYEAADW